MGCGSSSPQSTDGSSSYVQRRPTSVAPATSSTSRRSNSVEADLDEANTRKNKAHQTNPLSFSPQDTPSVLDPEVTNKVHTTDRSSDGYSHHSNSASLSQRDNPTLGTQIAPLSTNIATSSSTVHHHRVSIGERGEEHQVSPYQSLPGDDNEDPALFPSQVPSCTATFDDDDHDDVVGMHPHEHDVEAAHDTTSENHEGGSSHCRSWKPHTNTSGSNRSHPQRASARCINEPSDDTEYYFVTN